MLHDIDSAHNWNSLHNLVNMKIGDPYVINSNGSQKLIESLGTRVCSFDISQTGYWRLLLHSKLNFKDIYLYAAYISQRGVIRTARIWYDLNGAHRGDN